MFLSPFLLQPEVFLPSLTPAAATLSLCPTTLWSSEAPWRTETRRRSSTCGSGTARVLLLGSVHSADTGGLIQTSEYFRVRSGGEYNTDLSMYFNKKITLKFLLKRNKNLGKKTWDGTLKIWKNWKKKKKKFFFLLKKKKKKNNPEN